MGSVSIHLLVEQSLRGGGGISLTTDKHTDGFFQFERVSHILPADSSLAELMDLVVKDLTSNNVQQLTILDISYNPAKDISAIIRTNTGKTGPMSMTLQSMNWYPSGMLCILPSPQLTSGTTTEADNVAKGDELMLQKFLKWQSRNVVKDEDFAYNNPLIQNQRFIAATKEGVLWTGIGADNTQLRMKPSDIFTAVSHRSDNHDDDNKQCGQREQSKPPPKKKRSEKQRTQRLDSLIQNLAQATTVGKKKRVSDKVRNMLIKSRAEGNKKIRMEDRFHLELLHLIDVEDSSTKNAASNGTSYLFFSRVTTAGKVASSVAGPIGNSKSVEFLVSFPPGIDGVTTTYRRLPNTMSLHEAQQAGYLQEFDMVVIRMFSIDRHDEFSQSKSVLDPDDDENENEAEEMLIESSGECSSIPPIGATVEQDTCSSEVNEQVDHLQQRFHMAYQTAVDEKQ